MRVLVLSCSLALLAAPALAQPQAPAAPAEPPVCTTTTTVVKRGEVVLSTKTETRCEGEPGAGLHPEAVLGSLGSIFSSSPSLEAKEARGDWRVVEAGNRRICHVMLMSQAGALGRRVRTSDCIGPAGRAAAWKLEDNSVGLYGEDGALVVRLTGDRNRLAGATAGGEEVTLQR
jgi:hypothetical protein